MQKTTVTLISLCLFCLTASLPAAADIFSAPEGAAASEETLILPPMNPARVLRQRAVRMDWDEVSSKLDAGLPIELNLFADATLEVICASLSEGPDGSRICYGKMVGDEPGRVTLVVGESSLAATLISPGRTYKVRPIDDNWHVVREIRQEQGGATLWAAAATSDERTVWTLTNEERADNGLHALSLNGDLVASARAHSADMAAQDYFAHEGLDERSPGDRIAATGYEAWSWGENIAAGYGTPQAVVEGWMNSSGHRANILSDNYCDIGVGYAYAETSSYGTYWTQNFGRQAGVEECSAVDGGGSGDDGSDSGDGSGDAGGDGGGDSDGSDSGGDSEDSSTDTASSGGSSGGGCFIDGIVSSF